MTRSHQPVPVITIDGPVASGKGAVAQRVAKALAWHYLDSGALYRLVALAALRAACPLDDGEAVGAVAGSLSLRFDDDRILLQGEDVTEAIRSPNVSDAASRVAVHPQVRDALLATQRAFRQPPGLVADGRDMASVVFPDAPLKVYLTATAQVRAQRRYKQLIDKGFSTTISTLLKEIEERDARDANRAHSPLKPLADSRTLDSSCMDLESVVAQVLRFARDCGIGRSES